MGSFQNKLDNSEYDKLFHLQLVVTTNTGLNISIEKNEVIYMNINPQIPSRVDLRRLRSKRFKITKISGA